MSQDKQARLGDAVRQELERHRAAAAMGDTGAAWWALERAHILSQPALSMHLRVHWAMLRYAVRTLDLIEAAGQALRLVLAPIGNLTGRTPLGNSGRARVSAFAPMPVPAELRTIVDKAARR